MSIAEMSARQQAEYQLCNKEHELQLLRRSNCPPPLLAAGPWLLRLLEPYACVARLLAARQRQLLLL
jgi:hypothetical protein